MTGFQTIEITVTSPLGRKRSMPNLKTPGAGKQYVCKKCRTCIVEKENVLSWDFRGDKGKAALFGEAKNVSLDKSYMMLMTTGAYRVQNSLCSSCNMPLGWKFISACEKGEEWKEGHYVLELELLLEESVLSPKIEEYHAVPFEWRRLSDSGYGRGSMDSVRQRPGGPRRQRLE